MSPETSPTITPESRVGEIAAHFPLTTRVLARHGIDFCCGGGVPLRQACEKRGLSAEQIVDEMRQELSSSAPTAERWLDAPLDDLVRHIVQDFHRPLREELPRLETMARKVASVHAERDPEGRLPVILSTLLAFRGELEDHMMREEEVLFPLLLRHGDSAPVDLFVDDHVAAGAKLDQLRELTDQYVPPADACNTWRALWAGLEALEVTMHQHVHLENNILFPRATADLANHG